jgi:hypothetical protein
MNTDGRLIDFEQANAITQMSIPPRPALLVSGHKPYPTMAVSLVPVRYVSRPPYWAIQVVGSPGEVGADPVPVTEPVAEPTAYSVQLDLTGITGTEGVEVIGATRTERVAVPPGPAA